MKFWRSLFTARSKHAPQPNISFGRYTDAHKTPAQLAAWDHSLDLFESGQYLKAYREFFRYLRDDRLDNVRWMDSPGRVDFEFVQGSRQINGTATPHHVQVVSKLAHAENLDVGFLRRLVEHNYVLKFSRYALSPDNELCIVFDSATTDGSPLKLLHALRELSIHADKQDDLLFEEFASLKRTDPALHIDLPEKEKTVKYEYMVRVFEQTLDLLKKGKPDPNQYPGGYAYHILGTAYRVDYLVRPEGFVMDQLESMHALYFTKGERNTRQKIDLLTRDIRKILDRPRELVLRELYRTTSTFGVNPPVNHERVANLIEMELPNMDWHLQQGNNELALGIPRYIAGYAMFHFSPPQPDRELFHLFFRVTEAEFFRNIGFSETFTDGASVPLKKPILQAIDDIASRYAADFPQMKPRIQSLDFKSLPLWAKSHLEMIKNLKLS